jgi:hypothetical protein
MAGHDAHRLTRRQALRSAGGAAGVAVLGTGTFGAAKLVGGGRAGRSPADGQAVRSFRSRPDLRPPAVSVTSASAGTGYLFLGPGSRGGAQGGPLIVDPRGEPVWFKPLPSTVWGANFSASEHHGRPVLAWWEGEIEVPLGYGRGEGVLLDSAYRELGRIRAARGHQMDVHELQLTPQGTALFTCYPRAAPMDLTAVGGPRNGRVLESIIQEVDLHSGRLLMEWRSLEHIAVSESYRSLEEPYDYLHVNSIDIAPDGHLLISGRHTWSLYKLNRRTGDVMWRLGGKRSDFAMGDGTQFSWQHDGRHVDSRTISVFDNGSDGPTKTESQSRGLVLNFDAGARKVCVQGAYHHPRRLRADSMGSVQALAGGHVLIGWGDRPYASELTADGGLAVDAVLPTGQQSYRSFRLPWAGAPGDGPRVTARRDGAPGTSTLYVSWNGATDVARWRVSAGPRPHALSPVATAMRTGFETAIPLGVSGGHAMVTALDALGRSLASSGTVRL